MNFNRRILIVDDNASIHEDFKKILTARPGSDASQLDALEAELFESAKPVSAASPSDVVYEIHSAYQSDEALAMVRGAVAEGAPYALAFMDMRMPPGQDGVATTSALWQCAPETEVVLCSAYSDYSWEQILGVLGTSDRLLFLRKPYDAIEVRQLALTLTTKWSMGEAARSLIAGLEAEVQRRTAELDIERAKRAHAAKMVSLGEMAAGIAHEINNPLAIIKGNTTLLNDWISNNSLFDQAKALTIAARIEATVTRIAKIVKGLLDFSRSGDADPFVPVPLKGLVDSTLDFCAARFEAAHVKLTVGDIPPALSVQCRSVQISQVLLNLIGNGFDAVEKLPERWVRVEVRDVGDAVEMSVTDSGAGIPVAIRDKILFPFFTTKQIGKGTGLGLSIAKGIVDAHCGSLAIDVGHPNTRFVVRLLKVQPAEASAA